MQGVSMAFKISLRVATMPAAVNITTLRRTALLPADDAAAPLACRRRITGIAGAARKLADFRAALRVGALLPAAHSLRPTILMPAYRLLRRRAVTAIGFNISFDDFEVMK